MNNNELIKRYVYAVTRLLPKKNREDVAKELEANIDEMLEARCGEITPTEQDVRVVLAELGTPEELAQKYDTDPMDHLIGGAYYTKYKIVLKIVIIAAAIGSTLACILGLIFDREQSVWATLNEWLFSAIPTMIVTAFGAITFVFAILERKNANLGSSSIDNLPSIPEKREKIKISDCIVDMCFSVFFTVLILCFGDVVPVIANISDSGDFDVRIITLFNMEAVQAAWIPLVIWTVCTVVRNTVRIIEGRRNMTVLITGIITSVITVVCAYIFLVGSNVFNMDGLCEVSAMAGDAEEVITKLFDNIGLVLFACIAFGHAVDIVNDLVHALKGKSE